MNVKISSYCRITNNSISVDGECIQNRDGSDTNWAKQLYIALALDYPKFHKMDDLAKFGFLAAEFVLAKLGKGYTSQYEDDLVGTMFMNKSSSIVADEKFEGSYRNGENPSPGVFVYTLPNILIGELAIRNKWYGDNRFFIAREFRPEEIITQVALMMSSGVEAVMAGWVEVTKDNVDVLVFFVEKTEKSTGSLELSKEVLSNLHEN